MNITANTAAFYRGMKRVAAHCLRMRKRRVRPTRLRLRLRVNAGRYERQMLKAVAADEQVAAHMEEADA